MPIKKMQELKLKMNIIGSLSLKGRIIDDISFKNHKQNLENNKKRRIFKPTSNRRWILCRNWLDKYQ